MSESIILVEDEVKLAQFLEMELSSEGYSVRVAHDGIAGLMLVRESTPDLAILDWMLPGLSGVELCRRLRATGSQIPVILLTAKDEVSSRVAGLDAGAMTLLGTLMSLKFMFATYALNLKVIMKNA